MRIKHLPSFSHSLSLLVEVICGGGGSDTELAYCHSVIGFYHHCHKWILSFYVEFFSQITRFSFQRLFGFAGIDLLMRHCDLNWIFRNCPATKVHASVLANLFTEINEMLSRATSSIQLIFAFLWKYFWPLSANISLVRSSKLSANSIRRRIFSHKNPK